MFLNVNSPGRFIWSQSFLKKPRDVQIHNAPFGEVRQVSVNSCHGYVFHMSYSSDMWVRAQIKILYFKNSLSPSVDSSRLQQLSEVSVS